MSTGIGDQRFGAHLSIAGGMHNALIRGAELGCQCLQVFVKNQRQWQAKPLNRDDLRAWRRTWRKIRIRPVVAHASYLINLAGGDRSLWNRSIRAFAAELDRCEQLGIRGLVVHPGAHVGKGEKKGLARVVEALNRVYADRPDGKVRTLLETTAGQGSSIGHRFEQIAHILEQVEDSSRLGVCLDTAHIHAAGYDITTRRAYARTMSRFEQAIGFKRLKCIHVNDSARPLGSRVDRHAHIGQGQLGREPFRFLVNDPRLAAVPKILETPKEVGPDGRHYDAINLQLLRGLVGRRAGHV